MTDGLLLPDSAAFEADGHLSELGLSLLADGQDALLSPAALAHLAGCEACGVRLLELSVLSLSLGEELRALPPALLAAPARAALPVAPPLPLGAVALSIALAALGAVVQSGVLEGGRAALGRAWDALAPLLHGLRMLLPLLAERMASAALFHSLFAALLLVMGGWLVARLEPARTLEGPAP